MQLPLALLMLSLSPALACGLVPADLWALTRQAATAQALDPELLGALVYTESKFCPDAVSPKGALGLGQLMPATARELGVDPRDPAQNLAGAARYLRLQLDAFGSLEPALAAYNAGPGAVGKYGGVPPFAETRAYVREVARLYGVFLGQRPHAEPVGLQVYSAGAP